jgi:hypothetical protein
LKEVAPGIWHWQARHPEYEGTENWPAEVSSYAIDDGTGLLIFDPVAPPSQLDDVARVRNASIVLTNPWHDRDARSLVDRIGAPVWLPEPDEGTGDSAWLLRDGIGEAHVYSATGGLPEGLRAFTGHKWNELVVWVESRRAVVSGDTLVDFGSVLEIHPDWLPRGVQREDVAGRLRELLALPVEHDLPTHGDPQDRRALADALA